MLKADTNGDLKAVLTVQVDTASTVRNDIAALRTAIDNANHDALFMVDCIASLACDRYLMDEWGVDVTVCRVPEGADDTSRMSFVYFNDKAETFRQNTSPSFYWDWQPTDQRRNFFTRIRRDGSHPPLVWIAHRTRHAGA